MKPLRIYACEGCGRSIYRPRRTDRRKYCPHCAAAAVARNALAEHQAAARRRQLGEVVNLPDLVPAQVGRTA